MSTNPFALLLVTAFIVSLIPFFALRRRHLIFRLFSAFIVAAVVLAGTVMWYALSIPSGEDQERGVKFLEAVEQEYSFRITRADGKKPAVYVDSSSFEDRLHIYGEYSQKEIAEITQAAQRVQSRRQDKKTVTLSFYKTEHDQSSFFKRTKLK